MSITVNIYYSGTNGSARKFAEEMMDKPISYYAFQMLYWTGIREGELLALTPADDPETVLLIDSWESQAAIDEHHHTPMMQTIIALRDKYDLHMKVLRFLSGDVPEADHGFIRS